MSDDRDPPEDSADEPAGEPEAEAPPTAYERKLVRESAEVVAKCARRVRRQFPRIVHQGGQREGLLTPGDLLAIGHQALYRAARVYNETEYPVFAAFAMFYVRRAMLDELDELLFQERVKRAGARTTDDHCITQGSDGYDVMKHDKHEARRRYRAFANGVLAATFAAAMEEAERSIDLAELAERYDYERALLVLRAALARLEQKDRQMFALMYRESSNLKDAARKLAIPYGTARVRHARALKRLHELLVDQGIANTPRPLVVPHAGDLLAAHVPAPQNDTGGQGTR
jgi:RNA polymerase sigma factor (sigma-70 family)